MRKVIGVLSAQLVVVLATAGFTRAGAGDNQRFFAAGRLEAPSITLVASGVITGAGSLTAESADYRPADKTYRETDLAVIGGGTLTISVNGRFDVWPFALDPRTCTQQGVLGGTWTVSGSAADFAGTTGRGTLSGRFFTYARRGPDGCDETAIKGFVAGPMVGSLHLGKDGSH